MRRIMHARRDDRMHEMRLQTQTYVTLIEMDIVRMSCGITACNAYRSHVVIIYLFAKNN